MLQTQRFQDSCPFLDGHTDVLISRGSYWLKISGEFWYEFFIVGIVLAHPEIVTGGRQHTLDYYPVDQSVGGLAVHTQVVKATWLK